MSDRVDALGLRADGSPGPREAPDGVGCIGGLPGEPDPHVSTAPLDFGALEADVRAVGARGLDAPEVPEPPEVRLAALARAPVALRRALARVAGRMVATRGWERLGFARLADYAAERAGLSARELSDLAAVDRALAGLPRLEAAFLAGHLGWTKLRLLCRVAEPDSQARWLARESGLTARALAREVRAVDRRARETGALPDGGEDRRVGVVLRCSPRVRARWWHARRVAHRVAGQRLSPEAFAEALAGEVLSAVPLEGSDGERSGNAGDAGDGEAGPTPAEADAACGPEREAGERRSAPGPLPPGSAESGGVCGASRIPAVPPPPVFVADLDEGLDACDAFALDARLRRAVRLEARQLARVAEGLVVVAAGKLYRGLGFHGLDGYAEECLWMASSRARALLRIARTGAVCPPLRRAFAAGRLSWVQAHALVPLLLEPGAGRHRTDWIRRAQRVSVRRPGDDVEAALASGRFAVPALVTVPGEDSADASGADAPDPLTADACPAGLHTGANARSPQPRARLSFAASAEVARLFRAALATVRRRLERLHGRPSCESEALDAMLHHALAVWETTGDGSPKVPREHRVFARDGWRCTVPGCSSYRNLHGHHVRFRSAGGSDELANLTTLCAWHHLRGVHAGRVRVMGEAPHALRFALGLRPHHPPLAVYGAGEVRMQ